MLYKFIVGVLLMACVIMVSCSKNTDPAPAPPIPNSYKFAYKDSILYLSNSSTDYIVSPNQAAAGKYSAFPEGIVLDPNTGAINVSKSETGIRYRISFVEIGKTDTATTQVVISGINFLDGFYFLNTKDSIAKPLYNGRLSNTVPGLNNGTIFDEGSGCNNNGCAVNTISGQINLAATVRNKVFGNAPANNSRSEFEMVYRINDNSGKAVNKLKVKLYYFDTMADVTPEIYDIISSRQGTIFGLRLYDPANTGMTERVESIDRPRPPCIFIIAR